MSDFSYGFSRQLGETDFQSALRRIEDALQSEGFGILTSTDVQETLKKKLEIDFRPYTILGACNPTLAHQALQEEEQIGLLLPCNVVVQQQEDDTVVVSIADPKAMFELVDNPDVKPVAKEVEMRLRRVIQAI